MSEKNLKVNIAGVEFKNPILTASGTFGSGKEYSEFYDLGLLGGITLKGVSYEPWEGNPPPRIAETYGGMLNSIGLQNPGVFEFIKDELPFLRNVDTKVVVNVCGHTIEEYIQVVEVLNDEEIIDLFELNISCPNIRAGGITFGTDSIQAERVVTAVKKVCKKPLFVKLSPNVADIGMIARVVEAAGADGISLINTLVGMKIDIHKRQPILKNKIGGLSGPCIKPVAVKMIHQVRKAVKIPIIGMGGVITGDDAVELLMAGADVVAVGTANFMDPYAPINILDGLKDFMDKENIKDVREITNIID